MKHGIYYAFWEHEWSAEYTYYVHKVAKLGFDILEIGGTPLPDYSKEQLRELRRTAEQEGIILTTGYGPSWEHNIASPDPEIRAGAAEWFRKLFFAMGELDSHVLGGALYTYWPIDYTRPFDKEEDWKRSVEGVQVLSDLAKPYDINLGMEALNRFETYLINTAEEDVRFVKEGGRENVKVMLDTFHMNIEETSIVEAIHTAGSYLGHFHTGECNRLCPGMGRIPWREIGEALRDIGYNGTVVMEPFVQRGGQVGSDIHVWRDLSHSASEEKLDEMAHNAVVFQRYMFDET